MLLCLRFQARSSYDETPSFALDMNPGMRSERKTTHTPCFACSLTQAMGIVTYFSTRASPSFRSKRTRKFALSKANDNESSGKQKETSRRLDFDGHNETQIFSLLVVSSSSFLFFAWNSDGQKVEARWGFINLNEICPSRRPG